MEAELSLERESRALGDASRPAGEAVQAVAGIIGGGGDSGPLGRAAGEFFLRKRWRSYSRFTSRVPARFTSFPEPSFNVSIWPANRWGQGLHPQPGG